MRADKVNEPVKCFFILMLFPIFFVLHGYNDYYLLIPSKTLFSLLLKYFLIVFAVFSAFLFLLRNTIKTFIFCCLLLCLFFFFGSFHDSLKELFPNGKVVSYRFILPVLLIMFISLYIFIIKTNLQFHRFFIYFKFLLIILTGLEAMFLFTNIIEGQDNNRLTISSEQLSVQIDAPKSKPDIFFIVFDEYASSKNLKENLGFDNSKMDSLFEANRFFISYHSRSNYNYTFFSLASTFNLNYLNIDQHELLNEKNTLQGIEAIKNNLLVEFLKKEQYQIVNLGYFDFNYAPVEASTYFQADFFNGLIDNQTLSSKIERDIWWNFSTKNILTGELRIPRSFLLEKQERLSSNWTNYTRLMAELNRESEHPRFIYAHLMLPHGNYYLNEKGKTVSDTTLLFGKIALPDAYLNQLKYANTLIEKIVKAGVRPFGRERIIILEGDHGYRTFKEGDQNSAFENLNVYYFSDHDYSALYDGIGPVNTFRIVLNRYFGSQLKLLKDSSIYVKDPDVEKW